jgi:hypothetical protein
MGDTSRRYMGLCEIYGGLSKGMGERVLCASSVRKQVAWWGRVVGRSGGLVLRAPCRR